MVVVVGPQATIVALSLEAKDPIAKCPETELVFAICPGRMAKPGLISNGPPPSGLDPSGPRGPLSFFLSLVA